MKVLILRAWEVITMLLPFGITLVLLSRRRCGGRKTGVYFLQVCVFALYIAAVFYVTGAGTIFDLQRWGLELHAGRINLVPFSRDIDITGYLLNILLFVPFGFLLPLIWPGTDHGGRMVLSGVCFSLLIELSQLLNIRSTDVDDLILNTLGTVAGYLLFRLWTFLVPRGRRRQQTGGGREPTLYIAVIFLGRFLLFDGLGLAKMLYGF